MFSSVALTNALLIAIVVIWASSVAISWPVIRHLSRIFDSPLFDVSKAHDYEDAPPLGEEDEEAAISAYDAELEERRQARITALEEQAARLSEMIDTLPEGALQREASIKARDVVLAQVVMLKTEPIRTFSGPTILGW